METTVRDEMANFASLMLEANQKELDLIVAMVRTRQKFLHDMQGYKVKAEVTVGDYVNIKGLGSGGKYLNGCNARVNEIREDGLLIEVVSTFGAEVQTDHSRRKAQGWKGVVPFSCVEKE